MFLENWRCKKYSNYAIQENTKYKARYETVLENMIVFFKIHSPMGLSLMLLLRTQVWFLAPQWWLRVIYIQGIHHSLVTSVGTTNTHTHTKQCVSNKQCCPIISILFLGTKMNHVFLLFIVSGFIQWVCMTFVILKKYIPS